MGFSPELRFILAETETMPISLGHCALSFQICLHSPIEPAGTFVFSQSSCALSHGFSRGDSEPVAQFKNLTFGLQKHRRAVENARLSAVSCEGFHARVEHVTDDVRSTDGFPSRYLSQFRKFHFSMFKPVARPRFSHHQPVGGAPRSITSSEELNSGFSSFDVVRRENLELVVRAAESVDGSTNN